MILSEFKHLLENLSELSFLQPDGKPVSAHFHITEIGEVNKKFIDCGGQVRNESIISMQLWESIDVWHRLAPSQLISIIKLAEEKLAIGNHQIEIEYQGDTIGKYTLEWQKDAFQLKAMQTSCLATDQCGIPTLEKIKETVQSCCPPNSGCC